MNERLKEVAVVGFEYNGQQGRILASRGGTPQGDKNSLQDWLDIGFNIKSASLSETELVVVFEK